MNAWKALLWMVVMWCAVTTVAADDDDDMCKDDKGKKIKTKDCPHHCCIDGDCGTKSECKKVLIVVLSVLGSLACCAVLITFIVCYCVGCCCFADRRQDPNPQPVGAPLAVPMVGQPVPQQYGVPQQPAPMYPGQPGGYPAPPQAAGYPVDQGQVGGYPAPPALPGDGYGAKQPAGGEAPTPV